ncbi:MAG: hypothetical protein LBQ73_06895, partial [Tannerellaceae bacterium]|nr:hypothetical protein [Tannerellaceae bacterium]
HTTSPQATVVDKNNISIKAPGNTGIASLSNLPDNFRISLKIKPKGNYDELGLFLRATDTEQTGYKLELNPNHESVLLHNTSIQSVKNLRAPIQLDIIADGDFLDVCINNKRCIINRLPEQKGNKLFFYVKNGSAIIQDIQVYTLSL